MEKVVKQVVNHQTHYHKKQHSHGNRTLDIDQLAVHSGLAKFNPDLKIGLGIGSLIICLLSKNCISAIIAACVMIFVTVHLGKIKCKEYWNMILIPFTFIALSGIVILVDFSKVQQGFIDIPIFTIYIAITKTTIISAAIVSIKAFCGICCLYMISLSTPLYEIIGVLKRCRVPKIIIELMYLMYRFIFILLDAFYNMNLSAETRLGYITLQRSYQSFFGVCSNLLVVAFKKASRSFDAMEARGYDGTITFIDKKKPITRKQIVVVGIYFISLIMTLTAERIWL
jgi:cobalt/nickel transport system permease protein